MLVALLVCAGRAEESIQVRIAWGGSTARIWQGTISVDQGRLSELKPLGIEADEAGSMWIEAGQVQIRQPSGRLYDGLDLLVTGPVESAHLRVSLAPRGAPGQTKVVDVPLVDILTESASADLDEQGTRLLARRAPGDVLRIRTPRDALVFAPGESFSLEVTPNRMPQPKTGHCELRASLCPARSVQSVWEQEPVPLGDPPPAVPLRVPLNVPEGAYDLVLSVVQTHGLRLPSMGQVLVAPPKVLLQRKVQILVLAPESPNETSASAPALSVVEQIDPMNERWWERFAKPAPLARLERLPWKNIQQFWQGPLGSGDVRPREHALGRLSELAPSRAPDRTSWEAYTLPIQRPGRPHVLEVEYPSDVPQRLGISVMEPNAAGALMPIQLDSGVAVTAPWPGQTEAAPTMLRHRLIFWPRTRTPLVLVTNRGAAAPAVFGKIRVLAGWDHLPRAFPKAEIPPERLLAAYLQRPYFAESFCASEAYDAWSRRSLDDWVTFHEGGTRLVEYLHHVGMNGLMISVMADGATIYPSQVVQPTPRFDKGAFFATGQDPAQKDVLEMLFRLFDRERLRLVPAIEFGTPLAELEELLREDEPECEGIRWIGPAGLAWQEVNQPEQRLAPYYNVLHPRVQEAMLRVARELIERYAARHESFAGLAIQLSGNGYAVLPGPEWGLDDATIGRFERETGIRVPSGEGQDRFAQRAEFLLRQRRSEWLAWRSASLARFYERLQADVAVHRKEARVWLATADLMRGPLWSQRLRPTLPRRLALREVLMEVGLDTARYQRPEGPVLLYPDRMVPIASAGEEALALEAGQLLDLAGRQEQWFSSGSLFCDPPRELRLESFDQRSPYRESYTSLATQLVPSDRQNRRRFVHSLALLDSSVLFDGGRLVPMGQEEAIANLVAIYRRLPAVRFKTINEATTQPVTVRSVTYGGRTYVYAANDSPVPATLTLRADGPPGCQLKNLADDQPPKTLERRADGLYWKVDLAPYDLAAVWLSAADVEISDPQVALSDEVQTALASRIAQLGARAAALRAPPALDALPNANFEQASEDRRNMAGWDLVTGGEGAEAGLETTPAAAEPGKPPGKWSVRLRSQGPAVALVSQPFEAPTTGRLTLFVWLRVPDPAQQPPVELVLTGRWRGRELPPWTAILGQPVPGQQVPPISAPWRQFFFPVHDLPLDELRDLRVALRLAGPGEVWVDDVQLCHLKFEDHELKQLSQIFSTALVKLQTRRVGDCIRLLEGYWPQFLEDYVPLETAVASRPRPATPPSPTAPEPPPASSGLLDRMKGIKLW